MQDKSPYCDACGSQYENVAPKRWSTAQLFAYGFALLVLIAAVLALRRLG